MTQRELAAKAGILSASVAWYERAMGLPALDGNKLPAIPAGDGLASAVIRGAAGDAFGTEDVS
jgi:hypothetical protein